MHLFVYAIYNLPVFCQVDIQDFLLVGHILLVTCSCCARGSLARRSQALHESLSLLERLHGVAGGDPLQLL